MRASILCIGMAFGFATVVEARRVPPEPVEPVTHQGVTYCAPHSRMGYVEAYDANRKKLWDAQVYGLEFHPADDNENLQIYIRSLAVRGNQLIVVNEAGHEFSIDLTTHEVTSPARGMVAFESMGDPREYRRPSMVDIEVAFVRFHSNEVDSLIRRGETRGDTLIALWRDGKGDLVANPRVRASSGMEAVVKSVKEVIYPTALVVATNADFRIAPQVVPGCFETREVGVILAATPEIEAEGRVVHVSFSPEIVLEPEWRTYTSAAQGPSFITNCATIEQPFFHTYSLSADVTVTNGQTILVGGGIQPRDKDGVIYVFLTAEVVGLPK